MSAGVQERATTAPPPERPVPDGPAPRRATPVLAALVAAGATWVSFLAWGGFADDDAAHLGPLALIALVVGLLGGLGRVARLPGALVVPAQLLAGAAVAATAVAGSPLPVPSTAEAFAAAVRDAVESARTYAAPVPPDAPGIDPLLVLGGLVLLVLVDLTAGTLRRPALAGLPLLVVHALPVGLGVPGGGVLVFAAAAAAYLALLVLHEDGEVERWGRSLAHGGLDPDAQAGRRTAVLLGGAATAVAVLVTPLVPTVGWTPFGGGLGGEGGGEIELENPMVDLRRDLQREVDVPLVQVRTDDPDPTYVRISLLNRFTENAWSSGDRDLPADQDARGTLPVPEGVGVGVPRRTWEWEVDVLDEFASTWLPAPIDVAAIDAPGPWAWDRASRDFLAIEEGVTAAGLSYEVTRTQLQLTAADLDGPSASGIVDPLYTEVPSDLTPLVAELAAEVTAGTSTPFEQAVALQTWFRRDGGFTYSLDADPGNGGDALEEFLRDTPDGEGRTGYCEQFASAMAVMARTLGIPARVAVGFLRPERVAPQVWEYSAYDLHAWPELFFPGAGWVRFEPTPPGIAPQVPSWTDPASAPLPESPTDDGQSAPDVPDRGGEAAPAPVTDDEAAVEEEATDEQGGTDLRAALVPLLLVALLVAAALAPRALRRARSARRWGAAGDDHAAAAEAAWAELRDGVRDLGLAWPSGRSPRDVRDALAGSLDRSPDADPGAAAALARLAAAVEVARYAPAGTAPAGGHRHAGAGGGGLREDVAAVLASLGAGAGARARLRAGWLPVSLVRRDRPVGARLGDEVGGR